MSGNWHVGRKAIIAYLRPYLNLSEDSEVAWNMIRRWRKHYELPIDTQPNGKPYVDPDVFSRYWEHCHSMKRERKDNPHPTAEGTGRWIAFDN